MEILKNQKKALICGISGQDGAWLAKLLIDKGYQVFGTSRDVQTNNFRNLFELGIKDNVKKISMSLVDFNNITQVISNIMPDEIYNLAGQSSVGLSFEQPSETLESNAMGTLNLLEAIRFVDHTIRFYNACSGECFGDTGEDIVANEETAFRPRSPYAVAKSAAFWEVANYRDAYGLYACSGILYNHESYLRPERFVTQKIVAAACRIAGGSKETLRLGNIKIKRDWGWAPEYVEAMWRMLQQPEAEDFVIATGESHSLEAFVVEAYKCVNLDWREHVSVDDSLLRPSEIMNSCGSPIKARDKLGWSPLYKMKDVVRMMVEANQNRIE
jgi:GDPmannose 4,6-dehydratase